MKPYESLMARQTAQERLIEALVLALALDRAKVLPIRDVLETMRLMQLNASLAESEETGRCMGFVIDRLSAHARAENDPRLTLLAEIALHAHAGEARREPLQSWIKQAHPDELSDDIREALLALLARHGDEKKRPGGE